MILRHSPSILARQCDKKSSPWRGQIQRSITVILYGKFVSNLSALQSGAILISGLHRIFPEQPGGLYIGKIVSYATYSG